jgi:hypothetical protein
VKAERLHVGGVSLYRLERESLAPYRRLGAAEMEAGYDLLRLRMLLTVAQRYIAAGRPLDQLSPSRAVAGKLLPQEIAMILPPRLPAIGRECAAPDARLSANRVVDHAHSPAAIPARPGTWPGAEVRSHHYGDLAGILG